MTQAPDFSQPALAAAPPATFAPAPGDGVLPESFFSTTNLPTYVRLAGGWVLATRPRMDAALVLRDDKAVETVEGRLVRAGDLVALGEAEDGSQGIYVDASVFLAGARPTEFSFMTTEVSRERPVDYEAIAEHLKREKARGYLTWVLGPAVVHSRARSDMVWLIEHGFVHAVMTGNAVAVHDIEAALFGTTLGMSGRGVPMPGGHALHMRAINRVRAAGSIDAAVASGIVPSGIMHALVTRRVPYVLAGSIRDDGPLPGVITDALAAQEAMRAHAIKTTGTVLVASALHSIAFGNMCPAFHVRDGALAPVVTVAVDQTEFVVSKLKDRGTHQAYGVVTNAQDFLHVLRSYLA
jgi:lysine-ketoglutarate reductase/saccharopine dehydrogenase-like protein (TIGR00300 family)